MQEWVPNYGSKEWLENAGDIGDDYSSLKYFDMEERLLNPMSQHISNYDLRIAVMHLAEGTETKGNTKAWNILNDIFSMLDNELGFVEYDYDSRRSRQDSQEIKDIFYSLLRMDLHGERIVQAYERIKDDIGHTKSRKQILFGLRELINEETDSHFARALGKNPREGAAYLPLFKDFLPQKDVPEDKISKDKDSKNGNEKGGEVVWLDGRAAWINVTSIKSQEPNRWIVTGSNAPGGDELKATFTHYSKEPFKPGERILIVRDANAAQPTDPSEPIKASSVLKSDSPYVKQWGFDHT